MVQIKFVKTDDRAKLPQRNNDQQDGTGDTGYDIYAIDDAIIPANGVANVPIGLDIGFISTGYWIRIESRSGMFFRHGITSFPGVIDNSYRGKLGVALVNNTNTDYFVKSGDRIAQLVIYQLIEPIISWTDKKIESIRGENGFGSSGR
jgi:dUTP pyrophosphatase